MKKLFLIMCIAMTTMLVTNAVAQTSVKDDPVKVLLSEENIDAVQQITATVVNYVQEQSQSIINNNVDASSVKEESKDSLTIGDLYNNIKDNKAIQQSGIVNTVNDVGKEYYNSIINNTSNFLSANVNRVKEISRTIASDNQL